MMPGIAEKEEQLQELLLLRVVSRRFATFVDYQEVPNKAALVHHDYYYNCYQYFLYLVFSDVDNNKNSHNNHIPGWTGCW